MALLVHGLAAEVVLYSELGDRVPDLAAVMISAMRSSWSLGIGGASLGLSDGASHGPDWAEQTHWSRAGLG